MKGHAEGRGKTALASSAAIATTRFPGKAFRNSMAKLSPSRLATYQLPHLRVARWSHGAVLPRREDHGTLTRCYAAPDGAM